MKLIKKVLQFLWLIEPPKDGDGDGKIFDGTIFEQNVQPFAKPVEKKAPAKKKPVKKVAKKAPAKKKAAKKAK